MIIRIAGREWGYDVGGGMVWAGLGAVAALQHAPIDGIDSTGMMLGVATARIEPPGICTALDDGAAQTKTRGGGGPAALLRPRRLPIVHWCGD